MQDKRRALTYSCGCPVALELERAEARWDETLSGVVAVGAAPREREFPEIAVGLVRDSSAEHAYRFVESPTRWTDVRLGPGEETRLPFRLRVPWGIGPPVAVQVAVGGTIEWPPPVLQAPLELLPCEVCVGAANTLAEWSGLAFLGWKTLPDRSGVEAVFRSRRRERSRYPINGIRLSIHRDRTRHSGTVVISRVPTHWRRWFSSLTEGGVELLVFSFETSEEGAIREALERCLRLHLPKVDHLPLPAASPAADEATLPRPARPPNPDAATLPRPAGKPEDR